MTDKRGSWTIQEKHETWSDYIETKMWKLFDNNSLNKLENDKGWDFKQEAPCPKCGEKMLKAQYQGSQPNKSYSWDIDHINSDPDNNSLGNRQPMHPWCNKEKN